MTEENKYENFRMYYEIQYTRIDHLETKRENFSNYVITICSGIYILTISNLEKINLLIIFSVLAFIILINSISIYFIMKTWPLIKMHQKRAGKARKEYDIQLYNLNKSIKKPKSKFKFKSGKEYTINTKRHNIYIFLHATIIIFFIIVSLFSSLKKPEVVKPLKIEIIK